ncbi:PIG-L deacetylase family protein [Athalassotoga sp.]|uniref:Bacillithiol biosynthesis deacetylase BshB1 n=1 Tax=Caldisericum exile TaxID=693075 RepID=A0A2J6X9B3_9BACT|nr:MAG: hypothetical protein C0175_00850 [Caldisericum exile]
MKKTDILAISPHPDDVEIGCSGFILKARKNGYESKIVVATNGQSGLYGDSELRKREAIESSRILTGEDPIFLDEIDGLIENNVKLRKKISNVIRMFKPSIVISPYIKDKHPDHIAISSAVRKAIFSARSNIKELESEMHDVPVHIEMIIDPLYSGFANIVLDVSDVWNEKEKVLSIHSSQRAVIDSYKNFEKILSYSFGLIHSEFFSIRKSILKDVNSFF